MRYLLTFSYDGTNFYGYQKQVNKRTIQEEMEKVLSKISNKKVTISASGRTDKGVHALNQTAHFDLDNKIDLLKFKKSVNSLLPDDIYVKRIGKVSEDFHARFSVKCKEYEYKLNLGKYDPINRNYIYQYNNSLDINKMIEASKYLIGEHNFKTFTKATNEEKDYIRVINKIDINKNKNTLIIRFNGNGFLRYMVRNLVGTLIAIGENKIKPDYIKELILLEDRTKAKKTAPSQGLYLKKVYY